MKQDRDQTPGRKGNAARPLGRRTGEDTDRASKAQGRREQRSAGPDGPDATEVAKTFKKP